MSVRVAGEYEVAGLVTAVIPTARRPELLKRALDSVFGQTYPNIEVVVVVDGADAPTEQMLASIQDTRLRSIVLADQRGGGNARNVGIAAGHGEWIALLDDDDEWLPEKIGMQLQAASLSSLDFPIVCSRVIARSPDGDHIWPRRLPSSEEPLSEYMFARRSLVQGEGLVQSSMILAKRELMLRVPFAPSLKVHQDWDWVLRANREERTGVLFVPDPLVIWHIEEGRSSVSAGSSWQSSLQWIDTVRDVVTPRAYVAFLMTSVSARAARSRAWAASWRVLRRAFAAGRPSPRELIIFIAIWIIPQPLRWRMRRILRLSHA